MPFDVLVFDFDGTLVMSAAVKYDSFFALFPDTEDHRKVVREVLRQYPDEPREFVLPRMTDVMRQRALALPQNGANDVLISTYGDLVLDAVAQCPEMPGATQLLADLASDHLIYIFSNTPHDALCALVTQRGWQHHVEMIAGRPAEKHETISAIMHTKNLPASRIAVIGDGPSDQHAAETHGCRFFEITKPADLSNLSRKLETGHVQN
jgi:phosphoglycolate phosphatase-like HAD superfamily hydrolase